LSHNQSIGARGEDAAAQWYQQNGYTVLARNWRPGPGALNPRGELDLILAQANVVVFCEVKTRTSNRFGSGAYAVGHSKQQSLRRLATQWLRASDQMWAGLRFDVAVVDGAGEVRVYESCL
jgi:uncharacterized protein (TIGR00252 family)